MRMKRIQNTTVLVIAIAIAIAALAAGRVRLAKADDATSSDERQQQLIEVLLSDAPQAEKAFTCKRLTLCGD